MHSEGMPNRPITVIHIYQCQTRHSTLTVMLVIVLTRSNYVKLPTNRQHLLTQLSPQMRNLWDFRFASWSVENQMSGASHL